jgi:spore maturation protein CgeB
MTGRLRFRFFAHSWISDWNHGNAHFLRGLASELVKLGHEVRCYEERDGWSILNLAAEGENALAEAFARFKQAFPDLDVRFYTLGAGLGDFLGEEIAGADVVVVHEWNSPELVAAVAAAKKRLRFHALFHDTHHRSYTAPQEILKFPLREFDGVLAFGEAVRRIYIDALGVKRGWTFHEAADIRRFFPADREKDTDVVWIGNWGDEERSRELEEFLITPASALPGSSFAVYGVRYPSSAVERLAESKIRFRGYLPNLRAPEVYGRSRISLHVPRRCYANGLSGIPTIRVFEALAAGSPLLSAPWLDREGLFRPGRDYISVPDSQAMIAELRALLRDDQARQQLVASGLETIRSRHTCSHRAEQLLAICRTLEAKR